MPSVSPFKLHTPDNYYKRLTEPPRGLRMDLRLCFKLGVIYIIHISTLFEDSGKGDLRGMN